MQNSAPIFKDATCSFDCRLVDYKDSVHTAFCLGEVVALVSNAKSPLIYFDRALHCTEALITV
ncbi:MULTISPECIES: flavin reductase family protein [Vreelandella]